MTAVRARWKMNAVIVGLGITEMGKIDTAGVLPIRGRSGRVSR